MKPTYINRILFVTPAVLALWLTLSAIALILVDPRTFILALALLALTSTVSILRLFPFSGWVMAVISIIIFGLAVINLSGWAENIYLPILIAAVALFFTAWFGTVIANQVRAVNKQIEHDQGLIDDLRIRDPQTGLMRYAYAQQTLKNEIGRSRRNNSSLCLILAQVKDWDNLVNQQGIVAAEEIRTQIADIFNNTLRMVDTCFITSAFGAILPETPSEGALVVARRLTEIAARKSRVDLRIGVAHFPTDGVTDQELQKAAEVALQTAINSEQSIVLYSQVPERLEEVIE